MATSTEIKFQRYILSLFYHTSVMHMLLMKKYVEIKISLSWVSSPLKSVVLQIKPCQESAYARLWNFTSTNASTI